MPDFIQNIDFAALDAIRSAMKNPYLDYIMPYITHLASAGILWIVMAIVLLCIKKYRRQGLTAAIALALCFIVCNLIIKNIVMRTRPFDINTFISLIIEPPDDYSFPSGHTAASFAAASALLFHKNLRLGIPALIIAALIAFSRLYLYVHFPSDVLAGIILGVIAAAAAKKITDAIYKSP